MNYAGQGTTAQGNFTMYSIATMSVIALAMFISIKKKNEQEEFDFTVGNFGCFLSYASVVHDESIPSFFS